MPLLEDIPPITDCSFTVEWLVNDESITGVTTYNQNFSPLPFNYVFEYRGLYKVTMRVCNCCGCCEYTKEINVGPAVYVDRTSCGLFKLVDTNSYPPTGTVLELRVYNTDQVEIVKHTVKDYIGKSQFEIELPYDGIYIVEYSVKNTEDQYDILSKERFVIYEFCRVLRCYKQILMAINCKDCKPCIDNHMEFQQWLAQLNMFVANVYALGYNILVHSGLENGMFMYKEEYLSFLKETDLIINNLNRLCGNCGFINKQGEIPINCTPKIKTCCNG